MPDDNVRICEGLNWIFARREFEDLNENQAQFLDEEPSVESLPDKLMVCARNGHIKASNIFVERFLAVLVLAVQPEMKEFRKINAIKVEDSERFRHYLDVTISIRSLLPKNDSFNHQEVVKGIAMAQSMVIPFTDGKQIRLRNLIVESDIDNGTIRFSISPEIRKMIMDRSGGYRFSDFWVVRKLRRPLSYRLYKFLCDQEGKSFSFYISTFIQKFGVPECYLEASRFRERILEPVRKELDAVAPWSFVYEFRQSREVMMSNRRGKKKYDMVVIKPVHLIRNERNPYYLLRNMPGHDYVSLVDKSVVSYLQKKYDFSDVEIKSNAKLLFDLQEKMTVSGMWSFFVDITEKVDRNAKKRKGYFIRCCQNALKNVDDASVIASLSQSSSAAPLPEKQSAGQDTNQPDSGGLSVLDVVGMSDEQILSCSSQSPFVSYQRDTELVAGKDVVAVPDVIRARQLRIVRDGLRKKYDTVDMKVVSDMVNTRKYVI